MAGLAGHERPARLQPIFDYVGVRLLLDQAGIGAELPMQVQGNYAGSCPFPDLAPMPPIGQRAGKAAIRSSTES
jgi:hypothetical protein